MEEVKTFNEVYAINVNEHIEQKNGLNYLSWCYAWAEFKKIYPKACYHIYRDDKGLPFFFDEKLGYMVMTKVSNGFEEHDMWLPVMDGANKAMKDKAYTYKVKEYKFGKFTGNYLDKEVAPATMFDVNTALMRCLVKNIGMFGLGLYIYAGEDLPEQIDEPVEEVETISKEQKDEIMKLIDRNSKEDVEMLKEILGRYNVSKIDELPANVFDLVTLEIKSLKKL